MNRAVFLDRDGVINRAVVRDGRPYPPPSVDDVEILPGVAESIRTLHGRGFKVIVVTNQPDVATGAQRREAVEAIHNRLRRCLLLDDIKVCYHTDADRCACRKPKPGMLLEAANDWSIVLKRSFLVGDRWRDIEAGKAVGCRTFYVDYGYKEKRPENPDVTVKSLEEAARLIVAQCQSEEVDDDRPS